MKITTLTHKEFAQHLQEATVTQHQYQTPAGPLQILMTDKGIYQAQFTELPDAIHLTSNFNPETILLIGTAFQISVWRALVAIPPHSTISYQDLAERIGRPQSWRAVANAVGRNNIAYLIPCHRVVRKNGDLGGYRWGTERKATLLKIEKL